MFSARRSDPLIEMVGFDADDTLWHSEIHFQSAHAEFERIVGRYVDLTDARHHATLPYWRLLEWFAGNPWGAPWTPTRLLI